MLLPGDAHKHSDSVLLMRRSIITCGTALPCFCTARNIKGTGVELHPSRLAQESDPLRSATVRSRSIDFACVGLCMSALPVCTGAYLRLGRRNPVATAATDRHEVTRRHADLGSRRDGGRSCREMRSPCRHLQCAG
jgi:hypothetical protein